jgi:hypothetical protein
MIKIQFNLEDHKMRSRFLPFIILIFLFFKSLTGQTIALWCFDEQKNIYPSSVLSDQSENDYPLVIGPGGMIVEGRFGNALEPIDQPAVILPGGESRFGLQEMPIPQGRTVEPMTWKNARFAALMTSGENHLRKEVGFVNPTECDLNLADFNWTVEFWFKPTRKTDQDGVVFEIGTGPRGENKKITSLVLNKDMDSFIFLNAPSGTEINLKTNVQTANIDSERWYHLVFTFDATQNTLNHFVDGKRISTAKNVNPKQLPTGSEAYMSLARDGMWSRPLQGRLDELRISRGLLYSEEFNPPGSFSALYNGTYPDIKLKKGPPLLFEQKNSVAVLNLNDRKHLFIDDAIVDQQEHITFNVNPPRLAERVIEGIKGQFRKHLTIVEDENGQVRLYNSIHDDFLAVRTSQDGIHWEIPDLERGEYRGQKNIVLKEMVGGLGNPCIDVNGPPEYRWKYISGYHRRAIFLYTSPDGWTWKRHKTAILPFRSGTQSCTFYDDQRQTYVSYHRTGIAKTHGGATQRESVYTEADNVFFPWEYTPVTQADYDQAKKTMRLRTPLPWYLDNGPLTPGGFGIEYPHRFVPLDTLDPVGTDIYITKATKYPWAPDTYVAFPILYFHYEADGPKTRQILMHPDRGRGSGPIETHLSVSRDGINWKRYPRPAYVGNGMHDGWPVNQAYLAHGMLRRGNEIWQYYFGTEIYHSTYSKDKSKNAVYRVVQRLDGFVSADSPYEKEGYILTKPVIFKGNRLILNIDTDAAGYAQIGFVDMKGKPIPGFSVEDCIYVNGDFVETEVEWIEKGKDLSTLQDQPVKIIFRMRGSKLFAFQFISR